MDVERFALPGDWFRRGIPVAVELGDDVYVDSADAFDGCLAGEAGAVSIGANAGLYSRASLLVGRRGRLRIGAYTCVNGTTIVANASVEIGEHCLLAWGAVVTDTAMGGLASVPARRAALAEVGRDPERPLPCPVTPRPVVLGDNVWVGFDAVVGPGVVIGHGAVIGCKSVVTADVPPYAVAVGSPARVVATLPADDTPEACAALRAELLRADAPPPAPFLTGYIGRPR